MIDKIIDKIIDKYFAKKCIEEIKHRLLIYCLDFKAEKISNGYFLKVKKAKYKDYTTIGRIFYSKATLTYVMFEEYWEHLKENIEKYCGDKV